MVSRVSRAGKCLLIFVLAGASVFVSPRCGSALELLPRSFSRSKQFVVYAREGALRNAVGTVGDDTKNGILSALGLRDEWKIPIVVDLRAPDPGLPGARPPVSIELAQTGAGLKIQLNLLIGDAGRGTRIQDELVRATILALAYQTSTAAPAGRAYTTPPAWLVQGFSAYLDNLENGVSASMFAALLPTLETMSSTDFLSRDPAAMDSTSRGVYRACAYNLVCLLLRDLPNGRAELAELIRDLPNTPQAEANNGQTLGKYFPELALSPDALEKWWTLALAQLAAGDRFQIYTVEETEKRLATLLILPDVGKPKDGTLSKTRTLDDLAKRTPSRQDAQILAGLRNGLALLGAQGSPIYRPIIAGYQEVVAALTRGKNKGVAEHLRALEATRREAITRRDGIADYLNWYEATQMATASDAFDGYFHEARQSASFRRIHRPDGISTYLDSLETEFQ